MKHFTLPLLLLSVLAVHLLMAEPTEPFWNGDETRHVMTGIFTADALTEGGWREPRAFAEAYYQRSPALGLIVWPPGFYAVEGAAMLAFGRTFETARWLTVAYCLLACVMLYRLVCLTHGRAAAAIAVLLFAFSREVFFFSRNVMLEVPAAAFVLMAMLHLELFLRGQRRRDLWLCALACVLAGLHRYDAVLLAIAIVLRLAFAGRLDLLLCKKVLLAVVCVVLLLAPVYLLAAWEIGGVQAGAAAQGSDPSSTRSGWLDRGTFLLRTTWAQLGQTACAAAAIGLLLSFQRDRRAQSAPYWSMILATFLFFAPMAEQESRHAIYWVGAMAALAADAVLAAGRGLGHRLAVPLLAAIVIGGAAFWTLKQPVPWVRGYSAAAEHFIRKAPEDGVLLFDGHMSGTIVYEVRIRDPRRTRWLLRADKLLYAALSDPRHGYVEWADTDEAILDRLRAIAPDIIMVESPRARTDTPMSRRLRDLLAARQDLFEPVAAFPIQNNNLEWLDGVRVLAYRPTWPRPPGERTIAIPMLWQGRQLNAVIGPAK